MLQLRHSLRDQSAVELDLAALGCMPGSYAAAVSKFQQQQVCSDSWHKHMTSKPVKAVAAFED